ncbi:alpha/beta hydrolase [Corynebacterium guangdongense]|uniref:S-formylglutathione hydrolase FrmB n=1 Tax=Corynebacterium guangdongense TaxID=1783348 RepID=A0ABU1ZW58_9CORY|nr:alpha/beta hydrolase family protein [Corynebacterium guangdongense]MDR7329145.1 S-formylglutathione hydrolase FrmB [Corynebacterium guangdongense]WJZ17714.1 Diacylglycerol acyltransferase/mycolyltransferase Ag85A precursor [Corynebacterium guangdongense]
MNRLPTRAGAVLTAVTVASLGVSGAMAVPVPAPVVEIRQQAEQQLQAAIRSGEAALGLDGVDPADPRTWPVELIAAGVGVTALAAILLVHSSSTAHAGAAEDETPVETPPESAETSSEEQLDAELADFVVGSSRTVFNQPEVLGSSLNGLGALGSSDFAIPEDGYDIAANGPQNYSDTITEAKVIRKEEQDIRDLTAGAEGIQRWWVASPAMGRNVEIQIRPAADTSTEAPVLYLLDGVNAPSRSGWVSYGAHRIIQDNVTLVMPTVARASFYLDWEEDDEVLGRNQWETFLTRELPPLLESDPDLNTNGRYGVGGLSMGATGAVTLANANPELFDATFGISGCYSAESEVGYQTMRLTIESRGGDLNNLLGPLGSDTRERYDVVGDPEGLRDQAVYLSASAGEFPEGAEAGNFPVAALGVLLEQGAYLCTQDLERAMEAEGMTHQQVVYQREGVHNWDTFQAQLAPAWEHIRGALM